MPAFHTLIPLCASLAVVAACPARHAEEARAPADTRVARATVGVTCDDASLALSGDAVVARVNGTELRASELDAGLARGEKSALRDYCAQVSKLRERAVNAKIDEILLEKKAKAQSTTVEEMVSALAEAAVADITDEEVKKFYDERKSAEAPPFEIISAQVRAAVVQERQTAAVTGLIKNARAEATIELTLPDTRPPPVDVKLVAHTPTSGPADAPVTVVEFADFQCPYCQVMARSLDEVKSRMKSRPVRFAYRHFPLNFHAQARPAAEASQCAGAQGKFWPMHDTIFENMDRLDDASLRSYGEQVGLDMASFDDCLKSEAPKSEVQADYAEGERVGVSGTPTLFINGHRYEGELDPAAIVATIEEELTRAAR